MRQAYASAEGKIFYRRGGRQVRRRRKQTQSKSKKSRAEKRRQPGQKKINSPRKRRHEWVFRLCSSAGVRVCASSPLRARKHLSPCRRLDAKRTTTVFHLFIHADAFAAPREYNRRGGPVFGMLGSRQLRPRFFPLLFSVLSDFAFQKKLRRKEADILSAVLCNFCVCVY